MSNRHYDHGIASVALGCALVEVAAVLIIHDTHKEISWVGIGLAVVCAGVAVYHWYKLWQASRK